MTIQVTLSAEGKTQKEAYQKVIQMARVLQGKKVRRQGAVLPVKFGDVRFGSVQVEGVPGNRK